MKVCMITPDSYMIDRRIILEAKALVNAGHSVTLLGGFECKAEEEYEDEGVKIFRFVYDWNDSRLQRLLQKLPKNEKLRRMVSVFFMRGLQAYLPITAFEHFMVEKLMAVEADVIHVHDLPCLKVGAYVAAQKNIPLVYDAHEIYYSQDVLPEKTRKKLFRTEKKYIGRCQTVITVNEFIAELMAKRYGIPKPEVIMNCTSVPENLVQFQENNIFQEQYGVGKDTKIVLYQGWISPERNIGALVESVKYFPEHVMLALVGYGEYAEELKQIAAKEQTQDKILFTGEVPNEQILQYTAAADLGVIPYEPIDENHLYCSPNKLFEFVVGELPFICNDLPFLRAVKDKYGVLETAVMKDPSSIAETVKNLLLNQDKWIKLKQNCKKAKQELNWEVESRKLVSIYRQLEKAGL